MNGRLRRIVVTAITLAIALFGSLFPALAEPAQPAWRIDTPWTTETATVAFAQDVVIAEIADTNELRSRGLGSRDGLADGRGMLFVFDQPSTRTFWMKGMRFCIDIVWIRDNTVIGFESNVCDEPGVSDAELTRYPSPGEVSLVLELPGNWMIDNGYDIGAQLDIIVPESVTIPPDA